MSSRPRVEIVPARPLPGSSTPAPPAEPPPPGAAAPEGAKRLLAGGAVLAAGLIGLAALLSRPAAVLLVEPGTPTPDHTAALATLVAEGLPQSGVLLRDWAEIDGDGVHANGLPIVAAAAPTAIVLPPGAVVLVPFAGSAGCITLEVAAPGRAPYQLCLPPGVATPPIPIR